MMVPFVAFIGIDIYNCFVYLFDVDVFKRSDIFIGSVSPDVVEEITVSISYLVRRKLAESDLATLKVELLSSWSQS